MNQFCVTWSYIVRPANVSIEFHDLKKGTRQILFSGILGNKFITIWFMKTWEMPAKALPFLKPCRTSPFILQVFLVLIKFYETISNFELKSVLQNKPKTELRLLEFIFHFLSSVYFNLKAILNVLQGLSGFYRVLPTPADLEKKTLGFDLDLCGCSC